ncbi:BrnA antitoxin family protein [Sphingomonas naphthae]|uniref:BrnA antitoxin family protein n=1 Tax=Sphingomonas naphthae TaxID=1813468 RepID=A0ABY7TI89_9SPHN|nr:BrnA antitoxin family protein [Sphingomonas naphthae]WCT72145.1 BrnA antitoxin family protein [Sphingomonas naphthae]
MKNEKSIGANGIDPDDAPKLTQSWADGADAFVGETLVRRGRPKLAHPKRHVSLRLDPDVLDHFQAGGEGWQTRVNDALRKAAGL